MIPVDANSEFELWEGMYAEPIFGIVSRGTLRIHPRGKCSGEHCPFHNPSAHPLSHNDMVIRMDKRFLVERMCEHGIGHSDPDSVAYVESVAITAGERDAVTYLARHGCDGCCIERKS